MTQIAQNPPEPLHFFETATPLPNGLFGRTVVAASFVHDCPKLARADYAVLASRGAKRLIYKQLDLPAGTLGNGLHHVAPEELLAEIQELARLALADELFERAQAAGQEDRAYEPLQLRLTKARPFVGAWMNKQWHEEIERIANETFETPLVRYARLVRDFAPTIQREPRQTAEELGVSESLA